MPASVVHCHGQETATIRVSQVAVKRILGACSIPALVFPVLPNHRFMRQPLRMTSTTDSESLPAPAENSRWADARRLALIAFGYAITLKLALFLPNVEGILAAVWPPGGVALAALLLSPRRQRRAILATIFVTGNVVNLLSGRPALASVGFMVANVLESWGGAWLFARWCGERRVTFARLAEVAALAACALLVNSVSSLVGATAALLAINAPFHEFYVTWWISDGMGILLVTPLVVVCAQPWRWITGRHWLRWLEAMVLGTVWSGFAWIGFLGGTSGLTVVPRPYWMCVPLVWVGLRFGSRVTTLLLALLAVIAVWITVTGRGVFPLGGGNPVERLQMVQLFLGVVVLTGLTLAAVVAERKATEAALKLSEGKYRLLIETQSDLVIQFDPANRIQFVSPTYCATFGKSEAQLVGTSFIPLVHEDDKTKVQESLKRLLAPPHETQHEERDLTTAGWRWFAWTAKAVLSPDGQVTSIIGVGRDITLRKQTEEERQTAEEKYSRLVEGAPDIIYTFSSQRGGLYYSSHAEAALGYSVKHLLEHPFLWQSLIDPAALDGIGLAIQKFATGEPFDLEYRVKDSAGRWHWVRDRSIGRQQVGDDIIIEGIATDITDHKESEATLRILLLRLDCAEDAERRRIARELHDATGQKLAALGMTIGLLQDATSAPAGKTEEMFVNCLTLVEQCAQEIRTHSYLLHPPLLDELGLVAAIRDYAAGYSKRSGVQVTLDAPPNLERLPAEVELAVFRCVQESLGNIHRHAGASTAHIHLACDVEQVIIEVSDQGRGMSPETIRAIEARSGLTGVGIAGMQERVRHLGGRLEIESIGQGTTVRAIIPRQYTAP